MVAPRTARFTCLFSAKLQNISRKLNWMSRGDPTVDEITPAAALPMVAFGRSNGVLLQLGRENMTPDLIRSGSETEGDAVLALV